MDAMVREDAEGRQRRDLRLLGGALLGVYEARMALPACVSFDTRVVAEHLEAEIVAEIHARSAPLDSEAS